MPRLKKQRASSMGDLRSLEPDGKGVGLACSTTATIKKVKHDAAKTKEHYPDVRSADFRDGGKGQRTHEGTLGHTDFWVAF